MRQYPFAALITPSANSVVATHLPFTIQGEKQPEVLIAHMAKANNHWKQFAQQESLVIFSEPHSYISTRHYEPGNQVPTWNYVAVHVYGTPEILHSAAGRTTALEALINASEPEYMHQWQKLDDAYRDKLLNGIVAFRMPVQRIETRWKLSQNRTEGERERIIASLADDPETTAQQIGAMMKENQNRSNHAKTIGD
jgi:transcriptional regulator